MENQLRHSIELFLTQLVQAWRAAQLYPAGNPRIYEALSAVMLAVQNVMASCPVNGDDSNKSDIPGDGEFIVIRVTQQAFLFEDEAIAPRREPLRRLAEQLHEHGVKFLWLRPGLQRDELEMLLTAVASSKTVHEFEKGLAELDFDHIGLEIIENFQLVDRGQAPKQMDMLSYLRSKQARRRAPFDNSGADQDGLPEDDAEDISDLAEFFLDIAQGSEEKTQYLYNNLSDPRRLAETLTYLASIRPVQETAIDMPIDLVHQTLGHIADTIKQLPAEIREGLVRNIAEAVLTTETSVRTQVMDTAMAADIGKTTFVTDVCAALPDEVVAHLLSTHVRLHGGTANTISNFLEDFAADIERRNTIKHFLIQELRESAGEREQEVVSLLEGKPQEFKGSPQKHAPSFLTEREKQDEAREARARELTLTDSEHGALTEAVGCVSPGEDLELAALNLLSLQSAGQIAKLEVQAWDHARKALERAVDHGRFVFAARCLALADALSQDQQDEQARKVVAEFTPRLSGKAVLSRIIQLLLESGLHGPTYHALLGLMAQVGERAYEALFEALAQESNRTNRHQLIHAFLDLGEDTAYFLSRRVEHRHWYVVRNVVYLLGKLRSTAGISALEHVQHHSDIRVRREVLRAAASIRGPEAEGLLRRCLDDTEPVIRGLAAEWLGIINADGILEEFRTMLENGDKRLRACHELASGVVRALGRLGTSSDLDLIKTFREQSRGFGIIRQDDVTEACDRAMEDIRRREHALDVPDKEETKKR